MKTKIKYKPLILYVLQVLGILMVVDSTLFFDFDASESPKPKLNSYWEKNENGKNTRLIADYGRIKLRIVRKDWLVLGRSDRSDSLRLSYVYELDLKSKISNQEHLSRLHYINELDLKSKLSNQERESQIEYRHEQGKKSGNVTLSIRFESDVALSPLGKPHLVYREEYPPGDIYQKKPVMPKNGSNEYYYFKYNNKEFSIYCYHNKLCKMYVSRYRSITFKVLFNSKMFFYWRQFSSNLFQTIDKLIIEPGELDYETDPQL